MSPIIRASRGLPHGTFAALTLSILISIFGTTVRFLCISTVLAQLTVRGSPALGFIYIESGHPK